jgi:hypothetical protein
MIQNKKESECTLGAEALATVRGLHDPVFALEGAHAVLLSVSPSQHHENKNDKNVLKVECTLNVPKIYVSCLQKQNPCSVVGKSGALKEVPRWTIEIDKL